MKLDGKAAGVTGAARGTGFVTGQTIGDDGGMVI
jgi:hypothetical protein